MADLERMNLVITGHVDHGKSTSLGHMLFLLGQIHDPKKKRAPWRILERYHRESKQEGMASWAYGWVLDPLAEERTRGLTINISLTEFRGQNYTFNLIDAPGHSDFVKNLITGASQADAAILMVSAHKGEFEDGIKRTGTAGGKYANVIGMTTEHMLILSSLGISNIVVGINKMDRANWDKERFDTIAKTIKTMFLQIMKAIRVENAEEAVEKIKFIPTSGLHGVNLISKEQTINNLKGHIDAAKSGDGDPDFIKIIEDELENIQATWPDWYDGPSLLEALDQIDSPAKKKAESAKRPLRIPIQSVLNISGVGTVLTGRIASGQLKPNTDLVITPTKVSIEPQPITVKSIQEFHKEIPEALPGDNIGFNIKAKNLGAKDVIRGAVVSHPDNPAKVLRPGRDGFLSLILVVRSLGKKKEGGEEWAVHVNYTPVVHCGTSQTACRVTEIKDLSGKDVEKLGQNDRGMVWMTPSSPMVVEPLSVEPTLGRFAMRDSGKTVAVGIVERVEMDRYGK